MDISLLLMYGKQKMGKTFVDHYSLLHFAMGIVAYFWGLSFPATILLSVLFETLENTVTGVYVIEHCIPWWPGGKKYPDAMINQISDTLFVGIGYLVAKMISE